MLGFLRPRPRRAGSSTGASSCRQRLSARRLTILGASRYRARGSPDAPGPSWVRCTLPDHLLIVTFESGSPASAFPKMAAPADPDAEAILVTEAPRGRARSLPPTAPALHVLSAGALSPSWSPSPKPEADFQFARTPSWAPSIT